MSGKKFISPSQPSGVLDFLPEQQIARLAIIDAIRRVYERYGFDPLETPILERLDVLMGDPDDFDMRLWKANVQGRPDRLGSQTALRFDLTVPLARVVAANQNLPMPFRRWQYGHVMRGEKPQMDKGRYCEFAQLDVDTVGAESVIADAEIIAIMCDVMRELKLEEGEFIVRFNNRKLLNGLPELVGFDPDMIIPILRVIDKFDKIGRDGVLEELRKFKDTDNRGEELPDVFFDEQQIELFDQLLSIDTSDSIRQLDEAATLFADISVAQEGIQELRTICDSLQALDLLDSLAKVDVTIARGLGYYTGPVFETTLLGVPEIGSVFSGGRYDGLVNRFVNRELPATGASVGIDRLVNGLLKLGKLGKERSMTEVLILNLGDEYAKYYQGIAAALRENGCRVSVYCGNKSRIKGQLGYADRLGVPSAIILSSREVSSGTLNLKDLRTKNQVEVPFLEEGELSTQGVVDAVCKLLGK